MGDLPQGNQYLYHYTERNQLKDIQLDPALFGAQYQTPMVKYVYDVSGNRTKRTLLSGAYADYTPDELNRISSQTNSYTDPKTIRFDYGFDPLGRRQYERRDLGQADGYVYDLSDQLTDYNRDGTLPAGGTTVTGGTVMKTDYDNNGNRLKTTTNGAAITFASNALNQYGSTSALGTLIYDKKGNLLTIDGWSYTYDAHNRLTNLDKGTVHIRQHYDSLNRIIARDNNGVITTNVWDGWNLIEERGAAGAVKRCYLYGAAQNEVVQAFGGGAANMWYWQDGRGNTAAVSGDAGKLLERYRYGWQGNVSFYNAANVANTNQSESAFGTRFLFAGSLYQPESGLYDMRNRFYHPTLSRFLQTDPIGFKGDALNLYRYCGNDFVDRVDPMGLMDYHGDQQNWEITAKYLSGSKLAREIIADAERLNIPMYENSNKKTNTHKTGPNRVNWDPRAGIQTKPGNLLQTPALGAIHELDHAVQRASNPKKFLADNAKGTDAQYGNLEDRRVIERERKIIKDLNSGEGERFNHGGVHTRTSGPTSRIPTRGSFGGNSDRKGSDATEAARISSSAPSAAEVDAAHQATGVPSLGQEAVNFAPGRP